MVKYVKKADVKLVSYSRPLAGMSIIGEKISEELSKELVLPFIKNLMDIESNFLIKKKTRY